MYENLLRISDIQTNEILYYNEQFKKECLAFCEKRNIDCLPAITDHTCYYRREKDDFQLKQIPESQKVAGSLHVFDPSLKEKFSKHHVLFVFTHNELTGIIHFADYGRDPVSLYLYSVFFEYEKSLRQLLSHKYKDKDMIDFFISNGWETNKKQYNDRKKPNSPPFEHFSLKNLVQLLNHKEKMELEVKEVYDLRNQIMHNNELVNQRDINSDDYIYEISSFEEFFHRVELLFQDLKRVKSRFRFLSEQ